MLVTILDVRDMAVNKMNTVSTLKVPSCLLVEEREQNNFVTENIF